jgi:HEAT repeat protein
MGADAKDAVPSLILDAKNNGPGARDAAKALYFIGDAAVPALLEAIQDRDNESAVGILGQVGSKSRRAAPALVTLLRDPSAQVRQRAARTLGMMGRPAAAESADALREATKDQNASVRQAAEEALKHIEGR